MTIDPADEANGDSILLSDVLALPLFDEESMSNIDYFINCKLTLVALAVFVTRQALVDFDPLLFLGQLTCD